MKALIYVVFGFAVLGLAFWIVVAQRISQDSPWIFPIIALFGIPPIGAFWMMYMSIRHERKPLPMILLAFIPFTFVWYYFERIRPGKLTTVQNSSFVSR